MDSYDPLRTKLEDELKNGRRGKGLTVEAVAAMETVMQGYRKPIVGYQDIESFVRERVDRLDSFKALANAYGILTSKRPDADLTLRRSTFAKDTGKTDRTVARYEDEAIAGLSAHVAEKVRESSPDFVAQFEQGLGRYERARKDGWLQATSIQSDSTDQPSVEAPRTLSVRELLDAQLSHIQQLHDVLADMKVAFEAVGISVDKVDNAGTAAGAVLSLNADLRTVILGSTESSG